MWYSNTLIIIGRKDCLNVFLKKSKDSGINWRNQPNFKGKARPFTFSGTYPPPKKIIRTGYIGNGCQWCIDHWGTKWQPFNVNIKRYNEKVKITFETYSYPPLRWLAHVSKKYPMLYFILLYENQKNKKRGKIIYQPMLNLKK
ncbi:MAG: hypothetical protein ACOCQR_00345 [bacterium]